MKIPLLPVFALGASAALLAAPVRAAEPKLGWTALAEGGAAVTAGNTETISLNARGEAAHAWPRAELRLSAGLLRNSVEETLRYTIGDDNVVEESVLVPKAANYFAHADFMRRITDRFFWKAGGDWERDRFAGLDSRSVARAGVGYLWQDRPGSRVQTALDATFTAESLAAESLADRDDTFAGARLSADLERRFGGEERRNAFTSKLIVDQNLSDTDDTRLDFTNALALAINGRLSLKTQVQLRYDRQPALLPVDVFPTEPGPASTAIGQVAIEADELDVISTLSLVVNLTPGRPKTP